MNAKPKRGLNKLSDIRQTADQKRIGQLNDILGEIYFIEQELEYIVTTGRTYIETQCEALRKETVKGINHIENNPNKGSFFFPEHGYMFEKTHNIKTFNIMSRIIAAADRIEQLTKGEYPN